MGAVNKTCNPFWVQCSKSVTFQGSYSYRQVAAQKCQFGTNIEIIGAILALLGSNLSVMENRAEQNVGLLAFLSV